VKDVQTCVTSLHDDFDARRFKPFEPLGNSTTAYAVLFLVHMTLGNKTAIWLNLGKSTEEARVRCAWAKSNGTMPVDERNPKRSRSAADHKLRNEYLHILNYLCNIRPCQKFFHHPITHLFTTHGTEGNSTFQLSSLCVWFLKQWPVLLLQQDDRHQTQNKLFTKKEFTDKV